MTSTRGFLSWTLPVLGAGCLLVGACTTEQQSNPAPPLTTTTTTTTTIPATTTTTAPAPSTTAETTTTPAVTTLPAGPADALVPLLIGGADAGGWLFLGAWQQDRWQKATDPSGKPIRLGVEAGAAFTVTNLDGETPAVLGENVEACFDGRVGPKLDATVQAPDPPGFGYGAIALLTPSWPITPRPVAVSTSAPASYQTLGEAAFAGDPVDATQGSIEQLVVTDLDGDGDDEALVAFEFIQPSAGPGAPGDLAALLLVDTTTRASSTIESSFIARPTANAAPTSIIERFRVLGVADLNGDGRMEVVVHVWYDEGSSVIVYTYDGTKFTEVLAEGCGA